MDADSSAQNLKSPQPDEFAFIVRIWKDAMDEEGSISGWHGSIDHVGSNQRLYFYKLESIQHYVREHTGIGVKPVKRWWKKLRARLRGLT